RALVWQGTMAPEPAQPGQLYSVDRVHGESSCRQRAAILTASALPGTACTLTHHAPETAASAVSATVASSHSSKGRGSSAGWPSKRPIKRLRDAPTSRGKGAPRHGKREISDNLDSNAQLCAGSLANPRPGSTISNSGSTPAAVSARIRIASSATTSPTTSA